VPAAATKKRKLGTAAEGLGASDRFAVDLLGTCVALGEGMYSPELQESSVRMLKVIGGRWPRNVPIPWAAGEDIRTSQLAREMKIFRYGWNVAAVVSAVMEKDRQDTTRKRRAFARVRDPCHEVKMARGTVNSTALDTSKPPLDAKFAAPGPSKPLPVVLAQERRPPSPPRTVETEVGGAEVSMDISVDHYLVGSVAMFDAHIGRGPVGEFFFGIWCLTRLWCRIGSWATVCCPGTGGGWVCCYGDCGEGVCAGPMGQVLRQQRDSFGRCR
jgi:hypothetical protein